jgi:hypothetical protein
LLTVVRPARRPSPKKERKAKSVDDEDDYVPEISEGSYSQPVNPTNLTFTINSRAKEKEKSERDSLTFTTPISKKERVSERDTLSFTTPTPKKMRVTAILGTPTTTHTPPSSSSVVSGLSNQKMDVIEPAVHNSKLLRVIQPARRNESILVPVKAKEEERTVDTHLNSKSAVSTSNGSASMNVESPSPAPSNTKLKFSLGKKKEGS